MAEERVLVIDDDDLFRGILTRILTRKGLRVVSYANPALFFSRLDLDACTKADPCFDFLLTDNNMPGMSGLEFLIQLKNMGCKIPDRRKAIISGNWTDEERHKAKQLGCQVFDKSDTTKQLCAWLKENGKISALESKFK